MTKYLFVYHGGSAPETPEEQEKVMAQWTSWMTGLGPKLVDWGAPVGLSKTVSASGVVDDGGANPVTGYSMVEAESYDEATEMAKGCPIIADGGSVEVADVYEM